VSGVRALLLPVGGDVFAVPAALVGEVLLAPTVTVLPTAPPDVLGVFNLRGTVIPILDTARMLGGPPLDRAAFAVVVNCAGHDAALGTSSIPTMLDLGAQVRPSEGPGTDGTYLVGDRLVTMVDPVPLLDHAGLGADHPRAGQGSTVPVAG
jgi:purine-binding chemotaxis protein CheW